MMRYCCGCVILVGMLCATAAPARAGLGDFLGVAWVKANRAAHVTHGVSPGVPMGTTAPGPHRFGQEQVNSRWYGYGFGVPPYNWGYFGVKYRPWSVSHKGYYGDFSQWGYRRGY